MKREGRKMLSMTPKAIAGRAKRQVERQAGVTMSTLGFLTYEELILKHIRLEDGRILQVQAVLDSEFRMWFYALVDRFVDFAIVLDAKATGTRKENHNKRVSSAKARAQQLKRESRFLRLDETARWYLIDSLHGIEIFRRTKIELFVDPGQSQEVAS